MKKRLMWIFIILSMCSCSQVSDFVSGTDDAPRDDFYTKSKSSTGGVIYSDNLPKISEMNFSEFSFTQVYPEETISNVRTPILKTHGIPAGVWIGIFSDITCLDQVGSFIAGVGDTNINFSYLVDEKTYNFGYKIYSNDEQSGCYDTGVTYTLSIDSNSGGDNFTIDTFGLMGKPENIEWITQFGAHTTIDVYNNSYSQECLAITVDDNGNSYCIGRVNKNFADIAQGEDGIIIKLNDAGEVIWVKQFGQNATNTLGIDAGGTDSFKAITTDDSHLYICGSTSGNFAETKSISGIYDILALKLDLDGNIIWAKQYGSDSSAADGVGTDGNDFCSAITVDDSGNVYLGSSTMSDFSEGAAGSLNDILVIKLDSNGNHVWARQLGDTTVFNDNTGGEYCQGIAVDNSGNVFCGGMTTGALGELFGGQRDAFVLKLNSDGTPAWLKHFGADTIFPGGDNSYSDECYDIVTDDDGNVYCAGITEMTGGINGNPFNYFADAMIFKLSGDGEPLWITQLGAKYNDRYNSALDEFCYDIALSDDGQSVYCAGYSTSHLAEPRSTFDYTREVIAEADLFVMKVSSDGELKWARNFGEKTMAGRDARSWEECMGLDIRNGYIYCGGYTTNQNDSYMDYYEQRSFGGSLGETSAGAKDIFIMKYKDEDL